MTEQELQKQIAEDLKRVFEETQSMGCKEVKYFHHIPLENVVAVIKALEEVQQYRAALEEHEEKNRWIPCGQTWPNLGERVQVTYKGLFSGELKCDAIAFVDTDGYWHWDDTKETLAAVEITAWKRPGEPYRAEG